MRNVFRKSGFTLVELLVVMGIIGILMALLFPAIGAARNAAMKTKAQAEMKAIETACKQYFSQYGRFPHEAGNNQDCSYGAYGGYRSNRDLMLVFMAKDDPDANPGHANNTRKTIFLEVDDSDLDNDNFLDPWGNQYEITVDTYYDNNCSDMKGNYAGSNIQNRAVVVWSHGPKGGKDSGEAGANITYDDNLISWNM